VGLFAADRSPGEPMTDDPTDQRDPSAAPHAGALSGAVKARPPGVPSRRAVGLLVAGALAAGLLAGAWLAPAPTSSLAAARTVLPRLLALLAAEDGARAASAAPTPASTPPTPRSTPRSAATSAPAAAVKPHAQAPAPAEAPGAATTETPGGETGSSGSGSGSGGSERGGETKKPARLPPISHVWLVVASGPGFATARAAAGTYPYLTGTLLGRGVLLERYSAIEAYELAGDVALLTGGVGESVSTISEPATGQSETDAFLTRTVAPILASSAYGERGLIVVTFGTAAQEIGPPALSATTLASSPPAGALLLSQTLKGGSAGGEVFDSLAPRRSLEAIFGGA